MQRTSISKKDQPKATNRPNAPAAISSNLKIAKFVRFEVGEGMEKKNEDFAAEVAKQMNV